MRKIILFTILIFSLSSCGIKKIEISEKILLNSDKKDISFEVTEDCKNLICSIDGINYSVSNCEKIGINENFVYSFFNSVPDKSKQILLVYNTKDKKYKFIRYFPESSKFFEDDLVCIINEKIPDKYPLPELYEIKTTAINFKKNTKRDDVYHCRNWHSDNLQDFYYQKNHFRKIENFKNDAKYYDKVYEKYLKNETVYSCVWEQAHFPSFIYYYLDDSNDVIITNVYPKLNNPLEYRIPSEELIPNEEQKVIVNIPEYTNIPVICSDKKGNSEIAVLLTGNDKTNYNSYSIVINNGSMTQKIDLESVFEYQDEFVKIETASGINDKACFIISTKVFSYDMFIDLTTFETDIYLRASSFPDEERYFE